MTPYVGKNVKSWPYQQISGWEGKQQEFCKTLYRAWLLNPERKDYLRLCKANRVIDFSDRFNLLYVRATDVDNAYAFTAGQLELAMKCTDKAKKEELNAAKRRVSLCGSKIDVPLCYADYYYLEALVRKGALDNE